MQGQGVGGKKRSVFAGLGLLAGAAVLAWGARGEAIAPCRGSPEREFLSLTIRSVSIDGVDQAVASKVGATLSPAEASGAQRHASSLYDPALERYLAEEGALQP